MHGMWYSFLLSPDLLMPEVRTLVVVAMQCCGKLLRMRINWVHSVQKLILPGGFIYNRINVIAVASTTCDSTISHSCLTSSLHEHISVPQL